MRMQPDAASRPQDHAEFGICLRYNACTIYRGGAADAQLVRRRSSLSIQNHAVHDRVLL
jgi:hypothetical protein